MHEDEASETKLERNLAQDGLISEFAWLVRNDINESEYHACIDQQPKLSDRPGPISLLSAQKYVHVGDNRDNTANRS